MKVIRLLLAKIAVVLVLLPLSSYGQYHSVIVDNQQHDTSALVLRFLFVIA